MRKDQLWKFTDKVADFTVQDNQEKIVHLSDYAGTPVVLFFYPKANTPSCTMEACGFRDVFKEIQKADAIVLGLQDRTSICSLGLEEPSQKIELVFSASPETIHKGLGM
ncbi:MAG TPA: peroxiredoxin [Pseudacidobacterium sp.]|nr:peroxiredoxin [Pseudacidobacterium sp.]